MSTTYENMMTKGLASSLENTSVEDGKVRFTTDTNQLFIDADGERHEISDVMKKYTESEIKSLLAPLPKLYLSSDTHKLFVYASGEWIAVGKNDWIGTKAEYEEAVANGEILEGMTVYITDDYTGDGADLSIYCTYEYAEGNLVSKDDFSEISYPEYTERETLETLTSGESIKTALSKLAHAIADYISHKADSISHITQEERSAWTAKLGTSDVIDNVASTDTDKPLSANQGKTLQDQITTNTNSISALNSNLNISVQRYTMNGSTVDLSSMPNGIYITTLTNLTVNSEIGVLGIVQKTNNSTVYMTILSKTTTCDDWSVTRSGANLTVNGTNVYNNMKWSLALISTSVI